MLAVTKSVTVLSGPAPAVRITGSPLRGARTLMRAPRGALTSQPAYGTSLGWALTACSWAERARRFPEAGPGADRRKVRAVARAIHAGRRRDRRGRGGAPGAKTEAPETIDRQPTSVVTLATTLPPAGPCTTTTKANHDKQVCVSGPKMRPVGHPLARNSNRAWRFVSRPFSRSGGLG